MLVHLPVPFAGRCREHSPREMRPGGPDRAALNVCGYFNQIRFKLSFVPAREYLRKLRYVYVQKIAEQKIGLADKLHVDVLDPVMDHLDVMPGAVFPNVSRARHARL